MWCSLVQIYTGSQTRQSVKTARPGHSSGRTFAVVSMRNGGFLDVNRACEDSR